MESEGLKIYSNRVFVAQLIESVLCDKITVLEALSNFPKDIKDINIKCAFDALMHREADEDLRKRIKDYAQMQDEYLESLAYMLKENKMLPRNIIAQYLMFHKDDLISYIDKSYKDVLKKLKRMINF